MVGPRGTEEGGGLKTWDGPGGHGACNKIQRERVKAALRERLAIDVIGAQEQAAVAAGDETHR